MKYKVKRKAVLIGCPGIRGINRLRGVEPDLTSFEAHLRSTRGGRWQSDEIIILDDPSADRLLSATQMATADYLLIYFSGHGYTDYATGQRMLCCKDKTAIADIALIQGGSPRIMLISDACRDFVGEGIGSIPLPEPDYFDFTGEPSQYRELFDECILSSPAGKMIVHGTQSGLRAADSSAGGIFTQAFLHVAGRMKVDQGYQMINVNQVLQHVPGVIETRGRKQRHEIINYSGDLRVPFSIALPFYENERSINQQPVVQETIKWNQVFVAAGLFGLAFYLSKQ